MENDHTRAGFIESFMQIVRRCYENSQKHGFWDGEWDAERLSSKIALAHSELSEALECLRDVEPRQSRKIPGFLQIEEELADAVIRIMDLSGREGYRLAGAILAKMAYNEGRPSKHGRRF